MRERIARIMYPRLFEMDERDDGSIAATVRAEAYERAGQVIALLTSDEAVERVAAGMWENEINAAVNIGPLSGRHERPIWEGYARHALTALFGDTP
jgi:hypothetical protein